MHTHLTIFLVFPPLTSVGLNMTVCTYHAHNAHNPRVKFSQVKAVSGGSLQAEPEGTFAAPSVVS